MSTLQLSSLKQFCSALTGVESISERMMLSAAEFIRRDFGDLALPRLLDAYAAGGLEGIQHHELVGVARALCFFLYTGVRVDEVGGETATAIESEEDYFEAVLPRVIQAHPKGLSGGYFGHWHYPPEDSRD